VRSTLSAFTPVRAGLLVGDVRTQIRHAILTGRVAPGEALRDSVLAERMRVSRSPVREALRLLEESGLVTKEANRPYRVVAFHEKDLRELAGMRASLETLAVRLIVRAGLPGPRLDAELALLRSEVTAGSAPAIVRADGQFHRAVVAAAGNDRLARSYDGLRDQIDLAMLSTDAPARGHVGLVERHEDLATELSSAVASGDASAITARLEQHIFDGMGCPGLL
jgi:DNA-binding GntR family transcriptional regulator